MDLVTAPACSCTVIVRVPRYMKLPAGGSSVVVTGRTAPPRTDPGWPSIEPSWSRSRAASFLMTATELAVLEPPWVSAVYLERLRSVLTQEIGARLPQRTASVMQAMILGDRSALDADLRTASMVTGTAHLFAVSGLHVGTVLGLVLFVVGGSVRRWGHWVLAVVAVGLFVAVTGGEPPAIRALIMAAAAGYGRVRQQEVDLVNLLGLTILLELVIWPTLLLRPSFLLSTAVTAGLLWWVPLLVKTIRRCSKRRWLQRVAPMLSVHLVASAASALPGAIMFGSLSLTAPVINLVVVPMMMLALVATVCVLVAGCLSSTLAEILSWTPTVLVNLSEQVIQTAATYTPDVPAHVLPLAALAVTGAVLWSLRSYRARGFVIRLTIGGMIILGLLQTPGSDDHGVVCRRISDRIDVRVSTAVGVRNFSVGQRYGRPFVRSYHAGHSSDPGP